MNRLLQLASLALIGFNIFWLHSLVLGLMAGTVLLLSIVRMTRNPLYGVTASMSVLIIVGSFFYYTYKLTDLTIFITIVALPLIMNKLRFTEPEEQEPTHWPHTLLMMMLTGAAAFVLWQARTGAAIVSPWPEISPIFFILFLALVTIGFWRADKWANAITMVLAFSVALIVYKNGFGFDPFTHQAAEQYIRIHGAITPKTFYYIGHYVLTVIFSALTGASTRLVDSLMVPLGGGILLAAALGRRLGKYTALALLLPISYFTVTTPFSLALTFFVVLICLIHERAPRALQLLLAVSTLCIHPIVGVPALILVIWFAAPNLPILKQPPAQIVLGLISALVLPALFLMVGKFSPHWPTITSPVLFDRRYDFWMDIVNIVAVLLPIAMVVLGGIITLKKYRAHFMAALILTASGLLTACFVIFPNIISYEQENFSERILWLAFFLVAIPLLLECQERLAARAFSSRLIKGLCFSLLAGLIVSSVYLNYPRKDVYSIAKGWSVSDADLQTVQQIEADAAGAPYIVLANQATSAAALENFGFRYIKQSGDEFFFYPLPTSGRLYRYYLDIVYGHRNRAALKEAMNYANVPLGYFTISNYWWDAAKIKKDAALWADASFEIDNGAVTVFKIHR